jgi:acetyl esterase
MMTSTLDPELARVLVDLNRRAPAVVSSTGEQMRVQFRDFVTYLRNGAATRPMRRVADTELAGVPVRVYEPENDGCTDDVLVYVHGGGWVVGDLDSADGTARALAERLAARVVSVDYRLAPEHAFPAAFDDCLAVLEAVSAQPHRWLGIVGDSAGGNLAAAVAAHAPELVDAQLLIYPAFDPSQSQTSHSTFADGYLLTKDAMRRYWSSYRQDAAMNDPRMTPVVLDDLRGLPPTVLTTAGHDPLRDEGQEYAARLVAAGVPTTYLPIPALVHGWLDMTDLVPAARQAFEQVVDAFAALRPARPLST